MPDIQAPQYPAPIAPSFRSFSERQRMEIDDAIAAQQEQEERQLRLGKAGARGAYDYDNFLQGYMEAKYANPELTYWDYVKKPAVAGAFRAEGRKKIAEHIKAGGDIDELPGMTFSERHKAGLKGLFEKKTKEPKVPDVPTKYPAGHPRARAESALNVERAIAESEAIKTTATRDAPLEQLDPSKLLSKSAEMEKTTGTAVETIGKLIESSKPVADTGAQVTIGKIKPAKVLATGTDPATISTEAAAGLEPVAGEATKAGLKETLGKGVVGLGYGASVASGAKRLAEGKTTEEQIGGGLQVAGGTAGLVAMTNLWNPVGWAALIPAALSLGGGLMGGGDKGLAGTPLGKYRRRVGIG